MKTALPDEIGPRKDKMDRERLLLSFSLSRVKTAESDLHVSEARLEFAKKCYPKGLLTKEALLVIEREYIMNKVRYDTVLEEIQQRWTSLHVVEKGSLEHDG